MKCSVMYLFVFSPTRARYEVLGTKCEVLGTRYSVLGTGERTRGGTSDQCNTLTWDGWTSFEALGIEGWCANGWITDKDETAFQ